MDVKISELIALAGGDAVFFRDSDPRHHGTPLRENPGKKARIQNKKGRPFGRPPETLQYNTQQLQVPQPLIPEVI